MFSVSALAQQQQWNTLFVHFQQRHFTDSILKADANSEAFDVTYHVQCKRPPCKFHGFQAQIVFQNGKLTPQGSNAADFDGSACANATLLQSSYTASDGTFNVFVDEPLPGMLDTSNHLLFRYLTTVKMSQGDSALIEPAIFDVLKSADTNINSNIDTVIIDNAAGRFDDGTWYPFAVAYVDSTPVSSRKTYPVTVASDSIAVHSDSSAMVTLSLLNVDSAVVKNVSFRLLVDTAFITIDSISKGPMLASATLTSAISADTLVNMTIGSTTALKGALPAVFVWVHARHRHDTLCTMFKEPNMTVTNTDNAVSRVIYALKPVCVIGAKKDSAAVVDDAPQSNYKFDIRVLPDGNILQALTNDETGQTNRTIEIFSESGMLVSEARFVGDRMLMPIRLANGAYLVMISDADGKPVWDQKISVIR